MTFLGAIPALRGLPEAVLVRTAAEARPARYPAGTRLRPAGQPAEGVLLLLSGTVVAAQPVSGGGEVWTGRWTGPAIVDKPAVLAGGVPTSGLLAVTAISARMLAAARFRVLLEEHRSVREHVLRHLARDVGYARQRLVDAATLPAVARVAAWLHAQDPGDAVAWRGSQEQLARHLGLSRVTVNRALARLTGDGAVRRTPRGIVVTDRDRLGASAADLR
ncbi:CRP/FNR family transcriptional regulator, anaerobic regulatory protein [Micromonospora phaseoli]|uniref:CRP/FNR family transcriptional regulator, anaerobic regulatory protein n=1 Tax=Micromonospora phaseoli TaxID=1144548 RepID=A0A1H6UW86_9ACTN|nr:Crp/Fnr family transcriptional regulator [Micromonospora phaseoli]PZV99122.1 CRP/FNR family transcriptional regulator [Micromonospora phaseoli]GIJ78676.1 hypothetical protein Xph01_31080 [Micromonospora phaseoli]SEI94894.1 CRP/FNR family transcriptional regulator, anaerobic regulatory protein [Micromonospora phaseoli]